MRDFVCLGVRVKREDERGFDFDMMIEGKFFNWRQNMDFTDHLWNILMRKLIEKFCYYLFIIIFFNGYKLGD